MSSFWVGVIVFIALLIVIVALVYYYRQHCSKPHPPPTAMADMETIAMQDGPVVVYRLEESNGEQMAVPEGGRTVHFASPCAKKAVLQQTTCASSSASADPQLQQKGSTTVKVDCGTVQFSGGSRRSVTNTKNVLPQASGQQQQQQQPQFVPASSMPSSSMRSSRLGSGVASFDPTIQSFIGDE